jgi:hypothetical protein
MSKILTYFLLTILFNLTLHMSVNPVPNNKRDYPK